MVVSFGTSHMDTMDKTIGAIERQIQSAFPGYAVYRAFTSQMIIRKLKKTKGLIIGTVGETMEQMRRDGVESVFVQPTHIIHGIEYDNMVAAVHAKEILFAKVRVGKPLLSSVEDYKMSIHAVMEQMTLGEDEALVLMGHGTQHHANAAYPTLEYTFHILGYHHVLVGTVEGFPDLQNVMDKLEIAGVSKVTLMPFMVVAGDHAKNDMAGEEDSWKRKLEDAGYEVEPVVKGLGELEGIRKLFVKHLEEAMLG